MIHFQQARADGSADKARNTQNYLGLVSAVTPYRAAGELNDSFAIRFSFAASYAFHSAISGSDGMVMQAGSVELRLRRFDGEYRCFLARYEPLRDENGRIVNWYGTVTDIEDLKRAEQKIRESEQEFHRITDFIPQAITVLSPNGTVLYANRVALEQTGLTLDEVKKRSFFLAAFLPEDIKTLRAKRDAGLASGEPFELDLRQIRKSNGEHQWRLVQYNPMRDEQGRVIRWYVTGTDIQKQKTEDSSEA